MKQQKKVLKSLDGYQLTMLQIAHKLNIERASVCRRVRELEDLGKVKTVKRDLCPITKNRAYFFTRINKCVQGNLYDSLEAMRQ